MMRSPYQVGLYGGESSGSVSYIGCMRRASVVEGQNWVQIDPTPVLVGVCERGNTTDPHDQARDLPVRQGDFAFDPVGEKFVGIFVALIGTGRRIRGTEGCRRAIILSFVKNHPGGI